MNVHRGVCGGGGERSSLINGTVQCDGERGTVDEE